MTHPLLRTSRCVRVCVYVCVCVCACVHVCVGVSAALESRELEETGELLSLIQPHL
jgi:hypothetical protein